MGGLEDNENEKMRPAIKEKRREIRTDVEKDNYKLKHKKEEEGSNEKEENTI